MFYKIVILCVLACLVAACEVVPLTPSSPPTPTPPPDPEVVAFLEGQASARIVVPVQDAVRSLTDSFAAFAPSPGLEAELAQVAATPEAAPEGALPRHGLFIAFLLPLLVFGIPWMILETFVTRYVRPRGVDVTKVLIKGQDGLFIETTVSMTARKSLTLAAITTRWHQVRSFVEKIVEQELIHEAIKFPSLESLERNLKQITTDFLNLPVVRELLDDFGVEVLRFNIETRYPQETVDALNRRAEASAGGTAYLAYAAAAELDPNSAECRELYRIYQQTSGQVDAARNLGGGITSLANTLSQRGQNPEEGGDDVTSQ